LNSINTFLRSAENLYGSQAWKTEQSNRAEAAGFEAIVFSVDVPMMGIRRENIRNRYAFVDNLELPGLPTLDFVIS
ncbi:unnamed protein product, partial [Allacma fusca]